MQNAENIILNIDGEDQCTLADFIENNEAEISELDMEAVTTLEVGAFTIIGTCEVRRIA